MKTTLLSAVLGFGAIAVPVLAQNAQPAAPAAPATTGHAVPATIDGKPVYDEKADAKADIAAALAKAKKENRRVLIQWGGNWCPWCIKLNNAMKGDKTLAHTLMYEYDVVHVDIGQFDKNMDLAEKYGAELKKSGVPYLTVLDFSGKPVANTETGGLELSKEDAAKPGAKFAHDTAKVNKFLTDNQAAYFDAQSVYDKGLAEAKASNRKVFLHFGAPWCPWCHTLENWLAKPEIESALGKDFVFIKIDEDRMTGGKEFEAKIRNGKNDGIPWFGVYDAAGTAIATSEGPKGNIGYPGEPEEITHFASMLKKAGVADGTVDALTKSLQANKPTH